MGGYLAIGGSPVVLIARRAHAEAIGRNGLIIKTARGDRRADLDAVTEPSDVAWQPEDIIFVTTKSQDTVDLLDHLDKAPRETPVFCFQNGVRNEEWAAERFENAYGGLVVFSVNFVEPGVIEHTRNDVVAIGRYPSGLDEAVRRVGDALTEAGFRVTLDEDVMPPKWGKLLLNLNNAVYALVDTWLQLAYTDPDYRYFMGQTMREGLRVAAALDIAVRMGPGEPSVDEFIDQLEGGGFAYENPEDLPPDRRTYPSTWQDVVVGRASTEVDHFNGEIVRLGLEAGVPTPYNTTLLQMMKQLSAEGAKPGRFSLGDITLRVQEKTDGSRSEAQAPQS